MATVNRITPCLWFDTQGEEAALFYTGIFKNSRILSIGHYGPDMPGPEGQVMTVSFELDGQEFLALNGGPLFTFSEAISLQVNCADQDEVDYFWSRLSEGGEEGPCGWLKDKFGLSWQVTPSPVIKILEGEDRDRANRAMQAIFPMKKIEIATVLAAADGA
jgi:predicted 3-demethylubiquinone-9 3-methyltransferase (glyoxalase superfamily)